MRIRRYRVAFAAIPPYKRLAVGIAHKRPQTVCNRLLSRYQGYRRIPFVNAVLSDGVFLLQIAFFKRLVGRRNRRIRSRFHRSRGILSNFDQTF